LYFKKRNLSFNCFTRPFQISGSINPTKTSNRPLPLYPNLNKVENTKTDTNSVCLLIKKLGFLYADPTDF